MHQGVLTMPLILPFNSIQIRVYTSSCAGYGLGSDRVKGSQTPVRQRLAFLSIILLTILLSTSCGGGSASQAAAPAPLPGAVPASLFSLTVHSSFNWPSAPLVGIRLWSTGTYWHDMNPAVGVYDFSAFDQFLNAARAHNVDVIYTFGEVPAWASSSPTMVCGNSGAPIGSCAPPDDLNSDGTGSNQHWKDFVTAVVTHAAGQVRYWEVWNEPTVPGYWAGTNQQMLRLSKDAYSIIKSVDANALVTTPAPSTGINGVANWMGPYLALGGGQYADIITFHGYNWSTQPGVYPQPEAIVPLVNNLKAVLQANGQDKKPLWCTEGGWGDTTGNGFTDPDLHAAYLARHYLLQESEGVNRYYWFAWDNGFDSAGLPDGLWVPTTGITPAGEAYQQVQNWMVGATPAGPCSAKGNLWTCSYARANGYQAEAIWDASKSCSNGVCGTSAQPASSYVHYRDLSGHTTAIIGGTVPVGAKPILLENQ